MTTNIIHNEFPDLIGEKSKFYEYRKTALRWIQLLSGKEWTDYNSHDPGITILEALCYTLTEIDYKLDFSIEEILVSSATQTPFKLQDNAFYLAEDILTCAPVTENDYRKLIIDNVAEINNAWIIPNADFIKEDKTLEVLLLKKKQVELPDAIIATKKLLKKHKAYGSKIMAIKVAYFAKISLHTDIYIESDKHAETVLAEMFFNLNDTILNVNPNRQSFSELEEEGMDYNAIFDGPKMNNGIITEANLLGDLSTITLVKIKKILASTTGVEMINNLVIKHNYITGNKIKFPLKKDGCYFVPFFSPKQKYLNKIRVFKNQKELEINNSEVFEIIIQMSRKTKRDYVLKNQNKSYTYNLDARDRNIQDYYSIKNDFPYVYGLNEKGYSLIQNRNVKNPNQLKAYLLPFEQILANSFVRLAGLRNLFSIHDSQQQNFNQSNLIEEYKLKEFESNKPNLTISSNANQIKEHHGNRVLNLRERDRFLTHLLARFDVHVEDGFEMHIDNNETICSEQRILSKENMLQNIDGITYDRSVHDCQNDIEISSLEKELYLRLAINKPPKRPLYKTISELEFTVKEVDEKDIKVFEIKEFEEINYGSFKVERIKSHSYKKHHLSFHTKHQEIFQELLKAGISKSSYKLIKSANKKKHYVILSSSNGTRETLISIKKSKHTALNQVAILVEKFQKFSEASEGFYLIDHSLLNTQKENDISDKDFINYRMSFVFPDWTARFQNRSFQKQVERIVAKITPAHVRADCLWLNLEKMTVFENSYLDWNKAFYDSSKKNELANLSNDLIWLLKTYYPEKV